MASVEGYSAVPQEDIDRLSETNSATHQQQATSSQPAPRAKDASLYAKLKHWWENTNRSENAPLINRHRMTLQAPRKSPLRVGIEITIIVGIFVLVAMVILMTMGTSDNLRGELYLFLQQNRLAATANTITA